MNEKLIQLTGAQKKAVVALACMVEAQGKGGHFKTIDPETDIIIRECFQADWVGNWDTEYRHQYLIGAVNMDMNKCLSIVSEFDELTKFAFKNLLLQIVGDSALAMLAAGQVLKGIQFETPVASQPQKHKVEEKDTQEEDGTHVIADAFFARLSDINAIRADNCSEVFTVKESADDPGKKCGANYDSWKEYGVCPTVGVVGYVNPKKRIVSSEGTAFFLICEDNLIVPVLEWGLERIDSWEYKEKRQNNRILIYDKSGKRCDALRAMKKSSAPSNRVSKNSYPDKKVVHFEAHTQDRFEPGKNFPTSFVLRNIILTYTVHGSHLELEVAGRMKPRHAVLEKDDGIILTYRDEYNKTAYYEVETDPNNNTVVRVSIFQKNEYFETVEYRYTV